MLSSTLTISHESYCFARNIFPVSESKKVTAALETEQDPSHPVALVSWLQSFPASGSFPMSQFFKSYGQSCWSFSFSISPSINVHGWFSLELTDLISLLSKGLKKVFSSTTVWEHQFFGPQHSHLCSFPDGSEGKESVCNAGDPGSIPWSVSTLEKEMGTHSRTWLENHMDRGVWWATVHGVTESWAELRN